AVVDEHFAHVGRAGGRSIAFVFAGHTDREIVVAVTIEVGGGESPGETITSLRFALVYAGVRIGAREPILRAVNHMDHAGGDAPVVRRAHGQVVIAVAVEISRGEGGAEVVAILAVVVDAGAVLRPKLVAACLEAGRRAIDDLNGAGVGSIVIDVLIRNSYGQVVVSVAVKVTRSDD